MVLANFPLVRSMPNPELLAEPHAAGKKPREALQEQAGFKVLQVVEAANAGVGRHTLDLCQGLSDRGCEVHLIYSPLRNDQFFNRQLETLRGVTCVTYPVRREIHPSDLLAARFVRAYLRKNGPFDLVHGHSSKGGALARLATLGQRVPAVYTPNAIRTMHPDISPKSRCLIGWIERLLAKKQGAIVAVSPEEFAHLESLKIASEKICLIPNGVAAPSLPTREETRATLGLPAESIIIGFVGRFSEQKAPEVLLRAFTKVAYTQPLLRLAMIGWGEQEDKLKAMADQAQLAGRIDWLGEQPGQQSMKAFDVFALPSRYEGMPYVLLESLVAGLPIVCTRTAGAPLMVESGVNGELIEQNDPAGFAAALESLAKDASLRACYAEASLKKSTEFTLDRMLSETIELYQSLVPQTASLN